MTWHSEVHCHLLSVCLFVCLSVQITQEQVEEFMVKVARFSEKFKSEGPASVGTDLDKGTYVRTYKCTHTQLSVQAVCVVSHRRHCVLTVAGSTKS